MLGRLYEDEVCSAARTLEIVGERWSPLIVRNALFAGMTRFTEFQRALGVAPNVLAKRLADLVDARVFELRRGDDGGRAEYLLTEKGRDLTPIIVALTEWGDRWAAPEGPPVTYEHEGCGGRVAMRMECTRCGEEPAAEGVEARLGRRAREVREARAG